MKTVPKILSLVASGLDSFATIDCLSRLFVADLGPTSYQEHPTISELCPTPLAPSGLSNPVALESHTRREGELSPVQNPFFSIGLGQKQMSGGAWLSCVSVPIPHPHPPPPSVRRTQLPWSMTMRPSATSTAMAQTSACGCGMACGTGT